MKTTPVYALPYPEEIDTADVPRDVQALAQRVEVVLPTLAPPPTVFGMTVATKVASYVLAIADANNVVEMNVAGANTVTIPPHAAVTFPVGTQITICQLGAGLTSIVAGAGVTLRSQNGALKLAGQYAACAVIQRAVDDWYVAGNLVP